MRENRTYGSARVCISNGTFYFLIGPQIRYMEKRIKEKMAVKHIPVGVIPMEDYGRMDGAKVLEYAYSLMNKG